MMTYLSRALSGVVLIAGAAHTAQLAPTLGLSALPKIATVDNRYQSYNIEMVEVTGGRFWAPYGGPKDERYRQRPPLDLASKRIRNLAKHLAPAYVRYSGTWSINSYLPAAGEVITAPPAGYAQILTRDQWRGAVAFSKVLDAPIVTSFAASEGTRDAGGVWKTDQAQRLADLTHEAGGAIAAAEFFNEPNLPSTGHLPNDYGAKDYGRDYAIFRTWQQKNMPKLQVLGPGGVGEGGMMSAEKTAAAKDMKFISSPELMTAIKGDVDAVSYHHYGGVSLRCAPSGPRMLKAEDALSATWLGATLLDYDFYAKLRDGYAPHKPIWLTETAQAACGGSPWAASFRDSFRYINQLGTLAQKGVRVVMHNTLAASDYGLVDYDTMMPRPNYWAAVLWAKLMGPVVLAAPKSPAADVRIFAHCMRGGSGGVALVALNLGDKLQSLNPGKGAMAYVLSAKKLDDKMVAINGAMPSVGADGTISGMSPRAVMGALAIPAQSIAYVSVAGAHNPACKAGT
jgi:hypothetical protein